MGVCVFESDIVGVALSVCVDVGVGLGVVDSLAVLVVLGVEL